MFDVASRIVARCIDDGIHVPLVLIRGDVHAPAGVTLGYTEQSLARFAPDTQEGQAIFSDVGALKGPFTVASKRSINASVGIDEKTSSSM